MPVESAVDRATFLNADEFGAEGVYTPAGGVASGPISGIFDRPSIAAGINDAATVDARPTFCCQADALPTAADADAEDRLDVTGEGAFTVFSIEPDGTGMVLLRLGALV